MKPSLLDTDTLSYFMRDIHTVVAKVDQYLSQFGKLDISIVSYYEILRGLIKAGATRKLRDFEALIADNNLRLLDEQSCRIAAQIHADLTRAGTPLDDADILIASIAIANDFVLVTNNTEHYKRIANLKLDNWL